MDLTLSQEDRQIRRAARELAEEHFADDDPISQSEGGEEYPSETAQVLAEHDFLGMTLPEEYGGADMSWFDNLMAMEGLGEISPDAANQLVTSNSGNLHIIAKFANEELKERYLPPVTEGRSFIAIAMSEPEAGSAVTDMTTTAEEDGDEYVVNGQKAWVSGAPRADAFVTYVRMPDGNIGSILVDSETPGFDVADPDYNMSGGAQSQIFINDARIPKENTLVKGENSFKEQIKTYNVNRVLGMAGCWVTAKFLFEEALEYAQHREQGGKPISEYQAVQHRLTNMAVKLETSRWLIYRALSGDELPGRALSCMTKVYIAEKAHEVVDDALQIKGAAGFVGDTPEAAAYQRLRGYQLAGGTPDIHRNNVASALFKTGYPELN